MLLGNVMFTYKKKTNTKSLLAWELVLSCYGVKEEDNILAFGGLFRTFFFVFVTLSFNDVFEKQKVYGRKR